MEVPKAFYRRVHPIRCDIQLTSIYSIWNYTISYCEWMATIFECDWETLLSNLAKQIRSQWNMGWMANPILNHSKMDNPILNEKHLFFSQALSKYEKHLGKTFALQLCRTLVKSDAPLSTIVDHHHIRRLSWKRNTWTSTSHELQPCDLKHKPACRWTLYSSFM